MTDTRLSDNADHRADVARDNANDRFRAAVSAVEGVLWTNDAAGRMVGEQPGWAALTGQSPAEYEGYGWAKAVHPDDAQPSIDAWNESVARRETFVFEHRVKRHDGAWRLFSIRAVPLLDPDGTIREWVGVHTDITDRRAAEDRLREINARLRDSEAQLRLALDSAEIGLWDLDILTDTSFWHPRCKAMFGISADVPISMADFYSGLHPDDLERVSAAFAAAIDPDIRARYDVEYRTVGKEDGVTRWVSAKGRGLFDEDGRCLRAIGTVIDITRRRAQAEAAEASRRLLDAVLEAMPVGVVIAEPDGKVVRSNPANTVLWGEMPSADSIADYGPWVGYWPDGRRIEPHEWTLSRALERGETCHGELVEIERFGGGRRFTLNSAAPVRDGQGTTVAGIVAQLDVTERVEAERALQAFNQSLEEQIAQRTAELETAKVAAEAGARVKAEFLANMSHELRTPLTGMLGVHDLLRSDPSLNDQQRHFVDLAQDSGRALLTIVNDILDFSKIEAGQMAIERVPLRLRELVENCRRLGVETIKLKRVDLRVEVAADVPDLFLGDPTRIRQVVLNLITNAIKFTSRGEITVKAGWSDGRLRVEVSDTGIGIPAEVIPHLFERFSQADGSTARRFGGTGLGLAICKRLVELMDGTIGVRSAPGQGSTFWFALPLEPIERSQPSDTRTNPLATAATGARRLLVAEDVAVNREIIHAVLKRKGHAVTLVEDGAEAIQAFRDGVFDAILMDIQMPRVDGLTATREIRAIEQAEARVPTPVVALTANAMAEEAELCRRAGMDAHVAKPIDWANLFTTIDLLCERRAARASGSGAPVPLQRIAG